MSNTASLPIGRSLYSNQEALAIAAQAKVLSGGKLEQLVLRLQRHTGHTKAACWRFVIQYGLKGKLDQRRWTDEELDTCARGSSNSPSKRWQQSFTALPTHCVANSNERDTTSVTFDATSSPFTVLPPPFSPTIPSSLLD